MLWGCPVQFSILMFGQLLLATWSDVDLMVPGLF